MPRAWLAVAAARLHGLLFRRRLDEDFDEEIAAHIEMAAADNIRRGLTPEAARRAAVVRLGGPMQLKERHREQRSIPFVETTLQDVRYALRSMRRHPAFSMVAVATLAVGIGAGTAVFTFVRAILLRPLPFTRPAELVRIYETNPLRGWTKNIVAPANWADWRARNHSFTDIAAYEQFTAVGSGAGELFLTGFGEPQAVRALSVTGNFFSVLAAPPLVGRAFTDDETYEGRARVVILSYGLWQSAFGRSITLSGRAYEVVGVMPRQFAYPGRDVQMWTPLAYPADRIARGRRPHYLGTVARLRPGVTIEQARQEMTAIAAQLEKEYPDTNTQMGVLLESLHDSLAGEPRTALLMLSGAVGLLFLIVCANIASLQLGRAVSRSRELAIRRALGAGRARVLRQLLTESAVLSIAGGALGAALAVAAQSALTRFAASAVPLFADVRVDRPVLLFSVALSLAAPILFGIVPGLMSSATSHITERAQSATRDTRAMRNALVAAEVALSIVLTVGAVLLIRSLDRLHDVDPGFDQQRAVAFTLTLPPARYPDAAARLNGFREVERRLRALPAIESAGATSTLALRGFTWSSDATIEGRGADDYERDLRHASTTHDYFPAMGIRLLAGRLFEDTDTRERPAVAIVNAALARQYFRGVPLDQVVGRRITFGRPVDNAPWNTIVGVIADEKQEALDKPALPTAYSPIAQRTQNPMTFVLRSHESAEATIAVARRAIADWDKNLALTQIATLENVVEEAKAAYRFRTGLLSAFAAVALLLAALGIYGVLAYFVSQRSRELGIRLALGAKPAELFRLVLGEGMRPVAIGTAIGVAGALALAGLIRSLLFGVDAIDARAFIASLAALGCVAAAACALPALRAARVNPLTALRDE
jgi:putative ABC transport system permease protein